MVLGLATMGTIFASCTQDESPLGLSDKSDWQERFISVNVYREDTSTRTSATDTDGDLVYTWSKGDQLLVTDQEGKKVTTLVLNEEDAGETYGTFSGYGDLPNDQTLNLNFIYLGNGVDTGNASAWTQGMHLPPLPSTLPTKTGCWPPCPPQTSCPPPKR